MEKERKKGLSILLSGALLTSTFGPEGSRAFAAGITMPGGAGHSAWVLPLTPMAPATLAALQDLAGRAFGMQTFGSIQSFSPPSEFQLHMLGAMGVHLPTDFDARVAAALRSPEENAAELAALVKAAAFAQEAAIPDAEKAIRSRAEQIARDFIEGRIEHRELTAAAVELEQFYFYGPSVQSEAKGVEDLARAARSEKTLDAAKEIASKILRNMSSLEIGAGEAASAQVMADEKPLGQGKQPPKSWELLPARKAERAFVRTEKSLIESLGQGGPSPSKPRPTSKKDAIFAAGLRLDPVWDALQAAVRDDYVVKIFSVDAADKTQLVVLLGETHVKDSVSAEIGREVFKHFIYRGIEGSDPSLLWGWSLKQRLMRPLRPIINFMRSVLHVAIGRGEVGSTIHEAAIEFQVQEGLREQFRLLSLEERRELKARLSEKNPEASLPVARVAGKSIEYPVKEILKLVEAVSTGAAPLPQKAEVFHLEKGHKPDLAENLYNISGLLYLGSFFIPFVTLSLLHSIIPAIPAAAALSVLVMALWSTYYNVGQLLSFRFETSRWFQVLFPIQVGPITARNKTMAMNTQKIIKNHPEMDEILVMVGKSHVPGMSKLFRDEHGFREIRFP